jgi:hypothetical protein
VASSKPTRPLAPKWATSAIPALNALTVILSTSAPSAATSAVTLDSDEPDVDRRQAELREAGARYGTSLADLALMGVLTGLILGPAQALMPPRGTGLRWLWAAAMRALWALGRTATDLGGIAVDKQFTVSAPTEQ